MLSSLLPPCFFLVAFFGLVCDVSAQNYSIPSGWQNIVSNTSRAERLTAAWGAANEVQRRVDPSMGIPTDGVFNETGSSMVSVLALQDYHSGNSSWRDQVLNNTLRIYEAGNTNLDAESYTLDIAYYGLAEVAAYLAYNDSTRLAVAKRNFDKIYNSDVITEAAAQNGTYIRALNTTCGSALGGLVFGLHANVSNITVYSSATSAWVALSARLADLTGNTTYLTAAKQTIQFTQAHILSVDFRSALRISDNFDVPTCATTPGTEPYAWSVGPYIEGLSIVANVTQNSTYTQMLNTLIPGVVTIPEWHDPSGVLVDRNGPYSKGTLIRGLLEARLRNPSNTGLVSLIDSYLTLQYNAVSQNASIGNDDYRYSWLGGDSNAQYTTAGNIEALDVLNAAFVIGPTETSPEPPTNTTVTASPSTSAPAKHLSTRIGAIVGATVGGTAAVAAIIIVSCICLRRRRSNGMSNPPDPRSALEPEPFVLTAPVHDRLGLASTLEKGSSRPRVEYFPETLNDMPSDPSNPSLDAAEHSSATQSRTAVGDADALHALERRLERRLDNLIHTLAVHGETESNPPEYDGRDTDRA
ncbi:hypothetical protein PENSPDRAFT_658699 [Peniophora sp. CONT]|nr:hypothetical protein PENSPDRAFT_658699 [Peniophora sp. CONT]